MSRPETPLVSWCRLRMLEPGSNSLVAEEASAQFDEDISSKRIASIRCRLRKGGDVVHHGRLSAAEDFADVETAD